MPHFWATIFYVHNFVFGYGSKINVASWSLEIEVQFYLLVPFLLPLIFKVIQKNRYVLVALIVIYPIILFQFIDYNHTGLHRFFHYFLAGIVWCYIYLKTDFLKSTSFYYDVLLIFTLLMHVFVVFNWGQILPAQVSLFLNHNFLPITIFVLFMTCFKGTYFNKFLKIPFISIVGSMCYSIYLIHGFIITLVILLVKKHLHFGSYILDFVALAFIISPVVLFCCSIFYVFLERPFMDKDWPNKLIGFFRAKTQNNKL
jgi:peptidoglycan/LPS O-acetylase OafA/YrhL